MANMKMKDPMPKGFKPMIKALRQSHDDAVTFADMIEKWGPGEVVNEEEINRLETWLRPAKCDDSRKIARCIARCIYYNCLECT